MERNVIKSAAMVGREYNASFIMGDLKPTELGESNGWNFDATRDNAWRMDKSSGRVHLSSTLCKGGMKLFRNGFSRDLFPGRGDMSTNSRCPPIYSLCFL